LDGLQKRSDTTSCQQQLVSFCENAIVTSWVYVFLWFYMVLDGFTWFYMVLDGFTWFYHVLPSFCLTVVVSDPEMAMGYMA